MYRLYNFFVVIVILGCVLLSRNLRKGKAFNLLFSENIVRLIWNTEAWFSRDKATPVEIDNQESFLCNTSLIFPVKCQALLPSRGFMLLYIPPCVEAASPETLHPRVSYDGVSLIIYISQKRK